MPVRNEAAFIHRSLGSVLAQDYSCDRVEVIVADGESTDGTREAVAETARQHSNVKLINNPERIVATGLNRAVRVATGKIIVRVDGHCEIAPDYVSRCVAKLVDGSAECVGGPLETVGETRMAKAIAAAMSSRFGVGDSSFRVGVTAARLVDTVAFPAYKRETIQSVGDFDEELVRNQDDEYNYRLRKLGGRVLLSPDIHARYYSRASLKTLAKQYFQYGYWKVRVLQKHPRQMQMRQFVPALFVAMLVILSLSSPFLALGKLLLSLMLLLYTGANVAAAILAARRLGWRLLPLLPAIFAVLHLAYGSGFLFGLLKFGNRWQFSNRVQRLEQAQDTAPIQ
jgi:glycosyltransferase involved in cell wall biosynthesis